MSEDRLAEIRARSDRASEGPWQAYQVGDTWKIDARWRLFYGFDRGADAMFVANARVDVPWLLAEVERLTAALRGEDPIKDAPAWGTGPYVGPYGTGG